MNSFEQVLRLLIGRLGDRIKKVEFDVVKNQVTITTAKMRHVGSISLLAGDHATEVIDEILREEGAK